MDDMVERLARTMLTSLEAEGCLARAVGGDIAKCEVDGGLFDMSAVVRAVLEALRDPTKDMVSAGEDLPASAVAENHALRREAAERIHLLDGANGDQHLHEVAGGVVDKLRVAGVEVR